MHQIAKYARDAPNVYFVCILLVFDHFWCFEHGRAELRDHSESVILGLLTYIKINQFHRLQLPFTDLYNEVLGLDIFVAHAGSVQMLHS